MNYYSIPSFITSLVLFAMGFIIYLKGKKNNLNRIFFGLSASVSTWLFFMSLAYNVRDLSTAELLARICYVGIVFIPVTTFHFVVEFLKVNIRRYILAFIYIAGVLFGLSMLSNNLFVNGLYNYSWGIYPKAGRFHPLFLAFLFVQATALIIMLVINYVKQQTSSTRKNQIKYILFACIFLTASTIDFIPVYGISVLPTGYLFILIFISSIAYGTIRYRALDISLVITRTSIFIAVYSLVLGIPFFLAFGWRQKLINLLGENWWLAPLIVMTILATAGPFIYLYIQNRAEARLFQEQRRYQATLRQASYGMGRIKDLKRLLNLIVHIVTRTVGIEFSTVYITDQADKDFKLGASRSRTVRFNAKEMVEENSPIVEQLIATRSPLVYEEIKQRTQDYGDRHLARLESSLKEIDAAVVVPSFAQNRLIGILVFGRKFSGKLFSEDDLAVFTILANQAALAIENLQSFEAMKKAQEKLFQAEKLAYVGQLASSIVHEVRNPLTAIKTFVNFLPAKFRSHDLGFLEQFESIIPREIQRIEKIMHQLLDLGRPRPMEKNVVRLSKAVEITLVLLKNNFQSKHIHIETNYLTNNDRILGDVEQIQQVLLNLFLNALDAMEEGGRLSVKIWRENGVLAGRAGVMVAIKDTGCGIRPEQLKELFTPFRTTKKDGVGLGLIITQEIVKSHGGEIQVESEPGHGTQFTIALPVTTG